MYFSKFSRFFFFFLFMKDGKGLQGAKVRNDELPAPWITSVLTGTWWPLLRV